VLHARADDGLRRRERGGREPWLARHRPPADLRRHDQLPDFIQGSRGEFTVAKDIYVRPNSGWFSDRSVCYLASGRPVVTMKTGFSKFYPPARGCSSS